MVFNETRRRIKAAFRQLSHNRPPMQYSGLSGYTSQYKDYMDYRCVQKLLQCHTVKTSFNFMKTRIVQRKYEVQDNDSDPEIFEFIKKQFTKIDVEHFISNALSCVLYGYSLTEMVFEIGEDRKVEIKELLPIQSNTLTRNYKNLIFDKSGINVIGYQQDQSSDIIPIDKLLVCKFGEDFNPFLGDSLLNSDIKDVIVGLQEATSIRRLYVYRKTVPITVARTGALDKKEQDQYAKMVVNAVENPGQVIVGREDDHFEFVESKNRQDDMRVAIDDYMKEIYNTFFINDLMSQGAYQSNARTRENHQITLNSLNGIIGIINDAFNQLVKILVDYNYDTDKYPKFILNPVSETDFNTLITLMNTSYINKDSDLYKTVFSQYITQETNLYVTKDQVEIDDPVEVNNNAVSQEQIEYHNEDDEDDGE